MARRSRFGGILILAAGLLVTSCGDARLNKLTVGISKDSALAIMGGKPERVDPYFTKGRTIEALYFAEPGADPGTTPERELSPVVVIAGKVAAWGWDQWEPLAAEYQILLKR